ncbi:uncharacterized protein MYCFIDRAFT_174667 [Pseudocercospora fijiensis CIRAD86]|uniref:F-box domain-containing protein n=1 Tax=Pseudocercospora fijiensis (strain CIRAD86) TaxID=383855 RepID=M3B191_PSEFD|nr:uncharacterized protein MYCFIDRAFT_174667 [Pseudocercospora fijiensis CIRAD86]EME83187.1 hypothetical protein MYCFIDRAFT_174667 [Pseudocercospora fijiensis CIRAD86]
MTEWWWWFKVVEWIEVAMVYLIDWVASQKTRSEGVNLRTDRAAPLVDSSLRDSYPGSYSATVTLSNTSLAPQEIRQEASARCRCHDYQRSPSCRRSSKVCLGLILNFSPGIPAHSVSTAAFHFLDLPPELRDRIYSYATSDLIDDHSWNLTNLKPPPITRVSKAVLHESLAVLFTTCHLCLFVGTDFHRCVPFSANLKSNATSDAEHRSWVSRQFGLLDIHPILERIITGAGPSAIFRRITFQAYHSTDFGILRGGPYDHAERVATVTLYVRKGKLVVAERSEGRRQKFQETRWSGSDTQNALTLAIQVAEEAVAKGHFSGFTLEDLRTMAKRFRTAQDDYFAK